MGWQSFWKWMSWCLVAVALLLTGAIWVVDPYDTLPLSPPLERAPMASNQRYSYPALARSPGFDSLVVGTSTMRLLPPVALNAAFAARFANLSMNSATAYEQMRIVEVFARNHRQPKRLIMGMDVVWCEVGEGFEKYTFRRFPEWMYDTNPWNDVLHMLEFKTVEVLVRQAGYLLGWRKARYGNDGYRNFLPPRDQYDLTKVRQKIYGASYKPPVKAAVTPSAAVDFKPHLWNYPSLTLLEKTLSVLPADTRKILVFVPYHRHHQPASHTRSGAKWSECKKRVANIAGRHPNSVVLDFMIPSPITTRDENYWDPLHYSVSVADRLARLVAAGASGNPAPHGEYIVLEQER